MSVLVKGMKMPNRCAECILCNLRHGTKCKVTGETYYNDKGYARGGYDGKPDWCPLVEVPAPHGRLIDAETKIEAQYYDEEHEEWTMETFTVEEMISIADNEVPTVIEAEGTE